MDVLESVKQFVIKNGRYPLRSEYKSLGFTREMVRHRFSNMDIVKRELAKDLEGHILDLNNHKYNTNPKKSKRYIITTAVLGAKLHDKFYKSLLTACDHYKAELIFGISYPNTGVKDLIADSRLANHTVIVKDTQLNSNITLLAVRTGAKSGDPTTGKNTIGQRGGTLVTFSPKQRLRYVPTGPNKLPNAIMSTGAATLPSYSYKGIMPDLGAYRANSEHKLGAIIVEIKNDRIYHFRQIQALDNGSFVDLNTKFNGARITNVLPEAMILGDWHVGETDPVVAKTTFEMIKALSPRKVFLHDLADFASINPHEKGKQILLAKKAKAGVLTLSGELDMIAKDVKKFLDTGKQIYVVASNHDEFLNRYLEDSKFTKHPHNYLECLDLVKAMGENKSPLVAAMETRGVSSRKLRWLGRNDVISIGGVCVSAHGDKGANGSKGTPNTLENAYIDCVVGHSHAPQILRGVYVVGTSTELTPHYGPGQASSWMNTHCLLYASGQRQLINIIEGEWRL